MKKNNGIDSGIVYSTKSGRCCPKCEKAVDACDCSKSRAKKSPASQGAVKLQRETKGRKGKGVVVISGLLLDATELKSLAKELKQKCGSGGSVKQGTIEIQGDHLEILAAELKLRGYKLK